MKIGLIISSLNSKYLKNPNLLSVCKLFDNHVIVNQGINSEKFLNHDLNIINDSQFGLSNSRNKGIKYLINKVDAIVISDDDFIPVKDFRIKLENLKSLYESYPNRCILLKSKDLQGQYRKRYKDLGILKKKHLISVSSIDITFTTLGLNFKNLLFRTDLGLGSKFPACEDSYFVHNLYSKNIIVFQSNISLWHHPTNSTGIKLTFSSIYARWILFRKFYSLVRSIYLIMLIVIKGLILKIYNKF